MVNLHFSLLPRWRGAAPVERAILAGDPTTGVCVMAVDEGLDTGPVYARRELPVGDESLEELRDRLVAVGTTMLVDLLAGGVGDLPVPVPQSGEPTYAEKLEPDDLELDWDRPAVELARVVRLGRAYTTFRGHRLGVLEARCSTGRGAGPAGDAGRRRGLDGWRATRAGAGPARGRPPHGRRRLVARRPARPR